jgi:hypothetical protein
MIDGSGKAHLSSVEAEEPRTPKAAESAAPAAPGPTPPFVTRSKLKSQPSLTQNKVVLLAGDAVAVALLLFIFASAPSPKRLSAKGGRAAAQYKAEGGQGAENAAEQKSFFPVVESSRPPAKTNDFGLVGEQDVAHTATRRPPDPRSLSSTSTPPQSGSLGSIPPFDGQGTWQAPPYQPGNAAVEMSSEPKVEKEHPSLVFVQKPVQSSSVSSPDHPVLSPALSIGLPIGTRLRARLEAAASTAVKAPVITVVEYNYEKDGEIIVPAGSKAFGRIEQADRTGYMSIRFDSLLLPDGSRNEIDAVATNLRLGPLRGKVEGKHTGKNVLVRSVSGIGEVGALLVGRSGSINQPFSEGDVLRERIGTNIGEAGDQTLLGLTATEHIVVSIFADTPVYLILDRSTKQAPSSEPASHTGPATAANSVESLRQLLQLQRELDQSVDATSH